MRFLQVATLQKTCLIGAFLFVAAPLAHAQTGQPPSGQDAAAAETPQQMVAAVYAKTQSAKTLEDFEEIIQTCDAIEKSPGASRQLTQYARQLRSWALNRRGELTGDEAMKLREQGDLDGAERLDAQATADFQAAIDDDPTRWKAIHNRGFNRAMKGEFAAAESDFSRAVELRPNYANAWFNRGEVRYEMGKYREAVQDYTQSLRLSPNDPGAHTSRAHAYFQLKDGQRALEDYSKAIELDGQNAALYANRADCHQSLGRWESAAADYRRAIQLDSQLGRAYQGAAWLMATCPEDRFRDGSLAVQSAQKAIQLDGDDDFQYLDTLAAAQASAGQFDKAQQTIALALERTPDDVRPRLMARQELYEAGQPYRQPATGSTLGRGGRR